MWMDLLILGLVLTNFQLLATSRLAALINAMVFQGIFLSIIPLAMGFHTWNFRLFALVMITLAIKATFLPWLLHRAMNTANVQREIEPFVGYTASVMIGIAMLGLSCWIAQPFEATGSSFLLPGGLFTTLTGLMVILSRRKALTQVIGYLAMENGVYVFGAALAVEEPLLVEMGVLLDVFVAVFVMGITIHQISREFNHIDTDRLSELRD